MSLVSHQTLLVLVVRQGRRSPGNHQVTTPFLSPTHTRIFLPLHSGSLQYRLHIQNLWRLRHILSWWMQWASQVLSTVPNQVSNYKGEIRRMIINWERAVHAFTNTEQEYLTNIKIEKGPRVYKLNKSYRQFSSWFPSSTISHNEMISFKMSFVIC